MSPLHHLFVDLLLPRLSLRLVLFADSSGIARIIAQREEVSFGIESVVRLWLIVASTTTLINTAIVDHALAHVLADLTAWCVDVVSLSEPRWQLSVSTRLRLVAVVIVEEGLVASEVTCIKLTLVYCSMVPLHGHGVWRVEVAFIRVSSAPGPT